MSREVSRDAIIVILSQVPPNFTRKYQDIFINLYYQVETLVFGQAFERAMKPERIIIGSKNSKEKDKSKLSFIFKIV